MQEKNMKFKIMNSVRKNENIFYKKLKSLNNIIEEKNMTSNEKIMRYLDVKIKDAEKFIFHSSYYRICSSKNAINVTTVHDFTYEKHVKGIKKAIHSYQKKRAILKSKLIICISENTKKDLLHFIPEAKNKNIEVVYNGVSNEFYKKEKIENDYDQKYSKENYIVYVGARKGYKNFDIALDVASKLNNKLKFIIVGGEKLFSEEQKIIENLMGNNYEHLVGVTMEELNSIYNYAFCLIYPSSYEGFGIPLLEAMKAGCPVLAYNNSSIPEVAGPSLLTENNLTKEYLEKIKILKNEGIRIKIIEEGIEFSKKFSWDKMFDEILDNYKKISN